MTSMLPGPAGASATHDSHLPHGSGVGPFCAVQRPGQDPGARGLAAAARPAEQVGVVDPAGAQRLPQRLGDVFLALDLGERRRPVPAVERQARRGATGPVQVHRHGAGHVACHDLTLAGTVRTPRTPARARLPLLPSGPGGVDGITPCEGSPTSLATASDGRAASTVLTGHAGRLLRRTVSRARVRAGPRIPVSSPAEDSPSGLGRTLGKRVGGNPSRVRISHPPPPLTRQYTSPGHAFGLGLKGCVVSFILHISV